MKPIFFKAFIYLVLVLIIWGCKTLEQFPQVQRLDGSFIISGSEGNKLKITPYGEHIARLQTAIEGEAFLPNDHYEMVEDHNWDRQFQLTMTTHAITLASSKLTIVVDRKSLAAQFFLANEQAPVLSETRAVSRQENIIKVAFRPDFNEHFTGLGHGYYARANSIDLKGQVINRNYGAEPIEQAPLLVPFYMSNKGYGIFLNSTFPNQFKFAADNEYSFAIDSLGFTAQMDYFFIAGPELTTVLDQYTQLTGRPRLPQKAMFGLQLSDKGHDHNSTTPSDEKWWRQKITEHRQAGYPLDHVINDNRWRAAGGKRCESKIAWDDQRYPDPASYHQWLKEHGLVITLDFNRCIAQYSDGWQTSFNVPETGNIEFPNSAPDLTNAEFRQWFWQVFHTNALKPDQNYPGDALWIDEFDEQGHAPKEMILANGRSSGEMRNYWFFLIANALVAEGWDKANLNKRPFVWVRGMTAGAQRYATLWSGDIYPNYQDMAGQVRGMQLAGLSGFPYWGHDAGGFYDWQAGVGPDETMYQRWALAFGSFAPIWKPHGMGQSRWPLDRNSASQETAIKYSQLRYRFMPYLYSAAKEAALTGIPMTRAMLLDYQHNELAWQFDLQYMWGKNLLVAPVTQDSGHKSVWLPPGQWYDFFTNEVLSGDRIISVQPAIDQQPTYVKAGAIIPERDFALSTAFIDKQRLILNVYAGADGEFTLLEDDDVTEAHRTGNHTLTTQIRYSDKTKTLIILPAKGGYEGAPTMRNISLKVFGLETLVNASINHELVKPNKIDGGYRLDIGKANINQQQIIQFVVK